MEASVIGVDQKEKLIVVVAAEIPDLPGTQVALYEFGTEEIGPRGSPVVGNDITERTV